MLSHHMGRIVVEEDKWNGKYIKQNNGSSHLDKREGNGSRQELSHPAKSTRYSLSQSATFSRILHVFVTHP